MWNAEIIVISVVISSICLIYFTLTCQFEDVLQKCHCIHTIKRYCETVTVGKIMKSNLASFQRVPYLMPLNFRHSLSLIIKILFSVLSRKYPVFIFRVKLNTQKEITSQTDLYLLSLSSKTNT